MAINGITGADSTRAIRAGEQVQTQRLNQEEQSRQANSTERQSPAIDNVQNRQQQQNRAAVNSFAGGRQALNQAEQEINGVGAQVGALQDTARRAANPNTSPEERGRLQQEFNNGVEALNNQPANTNPQSQLNRLAQQGINAPNGRGQQNQNNFRFQENQEAQSRNGAQFNAQALGVAEQNLTTQQGAEAAVEATEDAQQTIENRRNEIGDFQNQIDRTEEEFLRTQAPNVENRRIDDFRQAQAELETANRQISQASQNASNAQANVSAERFVAMSA